MKVDLVAYGYYVSSPIQKTVTVAAATSVGGYIFDILD
jgi:hypothetical protein